MLADPDVLWTDIRCERKIDRTRRVELAGQIELDSITVDPRQACRVHRRVDG